jgi:PAS domain S-box-containing protein
VALAVLLGGLVYATAVSPQRATWELLNWLIAIAFVLPIAGALIGLLWYGRLLGGAVAEKTRAEEAVQVAEEGFRTVASTMADGIITIDDHSRIQYVNDAVERIFGYAGSELVGQELTMLMPESFRARHRRGIQRYLTTGTPMVSWESIQFQGRRKDGAEIPLEISIGEHVIGDLRVFTGIVRDITERKRSEQALAESEAKFRSLILSAPDGLYLIDPRATILDVNPAGESLIGRSRDQIVGHSLTEFIPEDRVPILLKYVEERVAGLRPSELYDGIWLGPGGQRVHVQVTSQAIREVDADPFLVVLVRDVTDQREMQRKLLESERWASMGRLASFVAHEINTPLTNISLLTASVARRVSDREVQERLRKISVQGKIAANITSELLRFARPGAINPVDTDIKELVQASIEQAEAFRKPATEIRTELGDRAVICPVDPLRIQEVFVNLLKNAYEATPTGHVKVRLEERGTLVAVAIADTGTGIPPEVRARLFEAFFTTKKKGEGTGLGLAISRNFVVSHGGDITASSEVGKGSTFTVLLPKKAAESPPGG